MMKRQLIAVLLAATLSIFCGIARADASDDDVAKATRYGTDFTGLWWNASENGWGVNLIQQSNILFATLFVYGPNNQPLWLVGPNVVDSTGSGVFSGDLFQTAGPVYSGAFNPGSVVATKVGTITIRFTSSVAGQITYTVNGASVTKNIVPQTWATNNLSGTYIGGMFGAVASCNLPLPQIGASLLTFTVTHSGSNATIVVVDSTNNRCTMTGTVTTYGKQSVVSGNYSCTVGGTGAFAIGNLEAGFFGMTGLYVAASNAGCNASAATIGAARVN